MGTKKLGSLTLLTENLTTSSPFIYRGLECVVYSLLFKIGAALSQLRSHEQTTGSVAVGTGDREQASENVAVGRSGNHP